uniref:Rab3 GTPase-activating protein catalytic subunit n=1 Tax=Ascaris lumbricoides TaxID=6252 RepID=A0A0M3HGT1_ASCLU
KHILVVPIVFCEKLSKKFYRAISNEKTITASKPVDNNDDIVDSDQQIAQESANPDEGDDRLLWADLQLAAICIVEVASRSALNTNDMLIFDQFVKKLELQLARLRGMNIDLKLESKTNRAHVDTSHVAKNEHEPKMDSPKERKVSDLLDANSLQNRWNKESYFSNSKIFSTRDPLSLILAYMPNPIFVDVVDFQVNLFRQFFNRGVIPVSF